MFTHQIYSNKYFNKNDKTAKSIIQFGENSPPQLHVDSQKIYHYFHWNWIEHHNHDSTIFKRMTLVLLDFCVNN